MHNHAPKQSEPQVEIPGDSQAIDKTYLLPPTLRLGLDPEEIGRIALRSGFMKRRPRKIEPCSFLQALVFSCFSLAPTLSFLQIFPLFFQAPRISRVKSALQLNFSLFSDHSFQAQMPALGVIHDRFDVSASTPAEFNRYKVVGFHAGLFAHFYYPNGILFVHRRELLSIQEGEGRLGFCQFPDIVTERLKIHIS